MGSAEALFYGKVLGTVLGTFQCRKNAYSQNSPIVSRLGAKQTHVGRHTTSLSRHTRELTGAAACVLPLNSSGLRHVLTTAIRQQEDQTSSVRSHRKVEERSEGLRTLTKSGARFAGKMGVRWCCTLSFLSTLRTLAAAGCLCVWCTRQKNRGFKRGHQKRVAGG